LISLSATYALANRLFDRRTALIAALLLAVSHFFIYYSREARMYSLFMAIATLCMWAYLRWMHKQSRGRTIAYGLCMGLLLHTHYIGVFIILAQLIHQLYHAQDSRREMHHGEGRYGANGVLKLIVAHPLRDDHQDVTQRLSGLIFKQHAAAHKPHRDVQGDVGVGFRGGCTHQVGL
jgi:uncharacterized membrane protein